MDRDFLHELFAPFGAIDIKRMFGGFALSADGLTFAIVARDALYFKADDETIPGFEREGCAPFQYEMNGVMRVMKSFWRMPERLYDDPDEVADWARAALTAARRAALAKADKKTRKPAKKNKSNARVAAKKRVKPRSP